MSNPWRVLVSIFLTVSGLALLWGGLGQAAPDSTYLYAAGAVLAVNGVGIFLARPWVRATWWVALAGALAYAAYYVSLPARHPEMYGPVTPAMLPMFLYGVTPLLLASAVTYFLPSLIGGTKGVQ